MGYQAENGKETEGRMDERMKDVIVEFSGIKTPRVPDCIIGVDKSGG